VEGHALLDLTIFKEIAYTLGISCRYVGEEPNSQVTNTYNQIMLHTVAVLPLNNFS